jgi:putative ABC transport system permease protein
VTRDEANAAIAPITRRLQREFPETNARLSARVVDYRINLMPSTVRAMMAIMLGAVAFVLLIACANVANLLLARAAGRQREIAVRAALGAGRGRIVRQLLVESVTVALVGGALGVLLARWGIDAVWLGITERLPYYIHPDINRRVLLFTLAVAVGTGILFGLAPALRASRPNLHEDLKDGARSSAGGRSRLRGALVVSELSLSLVLLAGAILMIRSFLALQGVSPGFDASRVLTMRVTLSGERYDGAGARAAFVERALRGIAAHADVEAASVVSYAPLSGSNTSTVLAVEGRTFAPGERPGTAWRPVSARYFEALRIPLVRGRAFTEREAADTVRREVIVNETLARRFFPGEDPVGRRIATGTAAADSTEWLTIVGVAADVRQRELDARPESQIYFPYGQAATRAVTFVARTRGDPSRLVEPLRAEVRRVDPTLAPYEAMTMEKLVAQSFWDRRLYGVMFGVFAAIAVTLAGIGIYGVMAYAVAQRTREIGVRMALGAQVRDVLRLVVGGAMRQTVLGVAIGLAGALAVTRVLSGFLYGVSPGDPVTLGGIALFIVAVALLASYVPARRAARVDPTISLRYE